MLVNFQSIYELAFMIFELGQGVVVGNMLITEENFSEFISMTYDA